MEKYKTAFGTLYSGVKFKCNIMDNSVEGEVYIDPENDEVYLCQNKCSGKHIDQDTEFEYTWTIGEVKKLSPTELNTTYDVTGLKFIPKETHPGKLIIKRMRNLKHA